MAVPLRVLGAIVVSSLASLACAGHYAVSYSQTGLVEVSPIGWPSWTHGYTDQTGGRGGGDCARRQPPPGLQSNPIPGTVRCSGTITATFNWVPAYQNEPPPQSVVVREYAKATYEGESGTCSNNLGDSIVVNSYKGTSEGIRASVRSGTSFSVSCAPTAQATVPSIGGDSGLPSPTASVFYKAEAWPVLATISGSKVDPLDSYSYCLVGQEMRATLSAGPATFTSYSWFIPGPVFKEYQIHAPDYGSSALVSFPLSDRALATPTWTWNRGGQQPVTCSATAVVDGEVAGTVNASRLVVVWQPTFTFSGTTSHAVSYELSTTSPYDPVRASSQNSSPSGIIPGLTINDSSVTTPSEFASQGDGKWTFTQIVKGHVLYNGNTTWVSIPDWWLDNSFYYGGWTSLSGSGIYDVGPFTTDSSTRAAIDTPSFGMATYTDFDVALNFEMHQLYRPPLGSLRVFWIPLNVLEWHWYAYDTAPWAFRPFGDTVETADGPNSDHPIWVNKYTN